MHMITKATVPVTSAVVPGPGRGLSTCEQGSSTRLRTAKMHHGGRRQSAGTGTTAARTGFPTLQMLTSAQSGQCPGWVMPLEPGPAAGSDPGTRPCSHRLPTDQPDVCHNITIL